MKNQRRMHIFHYLSKHSRKGIRENIKKLIIKGANEEVLKSCIDRMSIENKLL